MPDGHYEHSTHHLNHILSNQGYFSAPPTHNRTLSRHGLAVLMTDLPPLVDFFGHCTLPHPNTGLADSPLLQRHWDYQWGLVPNMAFDLPLGTAGTPAGPGARGLAHHPADSPPHGLWLRPHGQGCPGRATRQLAIHPALDPGLPLSAWFSQLLAGRSHRLPSLPDLATGRKSSPLVVERRFLSQPASCWLVHGYGWGILVVLSVRRRAWRCLAKG